MANTESAKKRIRSSERRRQRNRFFRTTARTYINRARRYMAEGRLEDAEAMSVKAISMLDKAARKGVIHPGNASRRKSRLMKAMAQARQSAG